MLVAGQFSVTGRPFRGDKAEVGHQSSGGSEPTDIVNLAEDEEQSL